MLTRIGAREARNRFADLLGRVGYGGDTVIVERSGKPLAVLVPIAQYEALVAERKAALSAVDRIRGKAPVVPEEEVAADVERAIRGARAARAPRRS